MLPAMKNTNRTGLRGAIPSAIFNADKETIVNREYDVTGQLELGCSNGVSYNEPAAWETLPEDSEELPWREYTKSRRHGTTLGR